MPSVSYRISARAERSDLNDHGENNPDKRYEKEKNSGRVKTLPLFFAYSRTAKLSLRFYRHIIARCAV